MSSTILAVIVLIVMWIVVLVPMVVRRTDESVAAGGATAIEPDGRLLSRRPVPATSSEPARTDARLRMMARRRRWFGVLVTVAGACAAIALAGSPQVWSVQVIVDLLLVGYLARLRVETRRAAERRRQPIGRSAVPSPPARSASVWSAPIQPGRPPRVVGLDEDPALVELDQHHPRAVNA